jgi:hypothetical protein
MRSTHMRPAAPMGRILIAAALLTLVVGCGRPQATTPTPTGTPGGAVVSTSSPTPAASQVVLVAPSMESHASATSLVAQAQSALQQLAASEAMDFTSLEALPNDETAGIAMLVALPPDPGLQAWAESHPEVQTVSLGITGLKTTPNLSVVAPDGIRYDQLGFALGYLAAMVTPEYRVGALALDASAASLALARGFVAGGTYYCGLCRPVHPPYVEYPVFLETKPAELGTAGLSTLLVAPQPQSLSELGLPADSAVAFVGVGDPAGDLASTWIASADFDVAAGIDTAWTQAQAGQAGTTIPLGIHFHSIDPAVVSEGRLRLAEALLTDLSAGVIDTGVDPLTGALR